MNIRKLKYGLGIVAMAIVAAVAMPSCTDERFDLPDYTVSGEPVMVSIPLSMPKMDVQTRADIGESNLNRVSHLMVRTYSASTGKATSDWVVKENLDKTTTEFDDESVTLKSESGYNYIIAIANADQNYGVTKSAPTERRLLKDLLEEADTWPEFLDIAVESPVSSQNVYAPIGSPLPMAGCYVNTLPPGNPHIVPIATNKWQDENFTQFFIPASKNEVTLSNGAIHLRRLVSHIKFNVKAKPDKNLTIAVNSFTVINAPKYSWLYERSKGRVPGQGANYGDFSSSEEDASGYYADVPQFGSQYITKNEDGSYSFDFWQGENKHESENPECVDYNDREISKDNKLELFTMLSGETWTPNNMASYVKFSCTIDYNDKLTVGENGAEVSPGTEVDRVGYAEYIVHLGYILGNDIAAKSKDFNCFRNTEYKYDVTIGGVEDIRVDAYDESIPFSGETGIVSDLVENTPIDLDAHYNVFNIELTEQDLNEQATGDIGTGFGFLITTYKNGRQYVFDETTDLSKVDAALYNWVELKKTNGANQLARYSPSVSADSYTGTETFLLADMNKLLQAGKLVAGNYTVFVNEYTYEPRYGDANYGNETIKEEGRPKWMSYVNQDPRRFYIKTTQKKSADGLRIYARSKYGVTQKSIQTYYNTTDINKVPMDKGVVGTERVNETEGLTVRSNTSITWTTSDQNGRLNIGRWVTKGDESILSGDEDSRPQWSSFIRYTNDYMSPQAIPAVTGNRTQGGDGIAAHNATLPSLVTISSGTVTFSDPSESTTAVEAMNLCMSRNRDNNGNGRIDPEEIRWYIPTIGKYLRLLLGAESLTDPVMNYKSVTRLSAVNNNGNAVATGNNQNGWQTPGTNGTAIFSDVLSRYMFVASNAASGEGVVSPMILWAMEGMSTSTWAQAHAWGGNYSNPWNVRCIRNLGTDLTTVSDEDKTEMAYYHEPGSNIVEMKYYDPRSIRVIAYTGNGDTPTDYNPNPMPSHLVTQYEYNMVYKEFEFSSTDLPDGVPSGYRNATGLQTYMYTNPCSTLNTTAKGGWRIPNQKEAAILRNLGILSGGSCWLTCTANYFNTTTGYGGDYTNGQNRFLVMLSTHGILLTDKNISQQGSNMRVRCVRDYTD